MKAGQTGQETGWQLWFSWLLKGMAMGAADAVPGVSGGTLAVMLNIYERLIHAIKSCNPRALWLWRQQGTRAFWRHIDGNFLTTLLIGILLALLTMANLVLFLLADYFSLVMAFFIGMVLAACWSLRHQVSDWSQPRHVLLLLAGMGLSLLLASASPTATQASLTYLFFSGMAAICAMILPGLSGAFILLVLGVYEQVLEGLRSMQWEVILVFAAGCALGLLSFAHVLSWALRKQRELCYAFLCGMMLASVAVLWPWRVEGQAVTPLYFASQSGGSTLLVPVLVAALLGAGLITLFRFKVSRQVDERTNDVSP